MQKIKKKLSKLLPGLLCLCLLLGGIGATSLNIPVFGTTTVYAASGGTNFFKGTKVSGLKGDAWLAIPKEHVWFKRDYIGYINVAWEKVSGADGYELALGTKKQTSPAFYANKFKVTDTSFKSSTGWGTKLEYESLVGSVKTPQVRIFVRPYRISNGKTTYGEWSYITIDMEKR